MTTAKLESESENLFLSKIAKSWLSSFNLALSCSFLVAVFLGAPRVEVLLPFMFALLAIDPMTESLTALKRNQLKTASANIIMAIGSCVMALVMAGVVWT